MEKTLDGLSETDFICLLIVIIGFKFLAYFPGTDQLGAEGILIILIRFIPNGSEVVDAFCYPEVDDGFRLSLSGEIG